MDNVTWRAIERELRILGFGNAATADLRARMEKGEREIEVAVGGRQGADDFRATLHFRKAGEGEGYSFDSFDLQVRKEGHSEWLRQRYEQTGGAYTLQQAYNLLAGRAVYKHIGAPGEKPYDVWLRLDFDRKLENGNYARKYYHRDDGLDLSSVLDRYPIRELDDARKRVALMDSLRRGDLAAVTMKTADGPVEKFNVALHLPTQSLIVQDQNGIRVSPEKLVTRFEFPRVTAGHADIKPPVERQQVPRQRKRLGLH